MFSYVFIKDDPVEKKWTSTRNFCMIMLDISNYYIRRSRAHLAEFCLNLAKRDIFDWAKKLDDARMIQLAIHQCLATLYKNQNDFEKSWDCVKNVCKFNVLEKLIYSFSCKSSGIENFLVTSGKVSLKVGEFEFCKRISLLGIKATKSALKPYEEIQKRTSSNKDNLMIIQAKRKTYAYFLFLLAQAEKEQNNISQAHKMIEMALS